VFYIAVNIIDSTNEDVIQPFDPPAQINRPYITKQEVYTG